MLVVIERAPDVLAPASPQCQAIRVVDFRPPVGCGLLGSLGEPVHRGHWRQSELTHVAAQGQARLDVHQHGFFPVHDEAIGPGDARAFQRGIERDLVRAVRWRLEVEAGEVRKLLRMAGGGYVDSDAACRKTVLVQLADTAEIGGAEESNPVVLVPVEILLICLAAFLETEARKACAFGQLPRGTVRRHGEVAGIVNDLPRGKGTARWREHVHVHRCGEKMP